MKHRSISIILLFIVSAMLIGIFAGCEGIGNDHSDEYVDVFWQYTPELEPLTKSQIDDFNLAYFIEQYGMTPAEYIKAAPKDEKDEAKNIAESALISDSMHDKDYMYLGTFNGSIVIVIIGNFMEGTVYKLGNLSFETYNGSTGYVYNNGEIYGIEEAYECGLLTDEDAELIVERRNKYYEMLNKIFNGENN